MIIRVGTSDYEVEFRSWAKKVRCTLVTVHHLPGMLALVSIHNQYAREYRNEEEYQERLEIFIRNAKHINQVNEGQSSYER